MDPQKWQQWVMQTATTLEDLDGIVKETGIERVDREHSRLFEYILEMGEVIRHSNTTLFDSEQLATQHLLFDRFLNALTQHFKTEEHFFKTYNLKGKSQQQREHTKILSVFKRILSDFEKGVLSTFQAARINLISELVHHINDVDCHTFKVENFLPVLRDAATWDDVSEIIKSTGLPFVDQEHKELTVNIIGLKMLFSKYGYAIKTLSHKEEALNHIKGLFEYTQTHFSHEEAFLRQYDLDVRRQADQHEIFLNHIFNVGRKIETNQNVDLQKVADFLLSWWVNHISGIDYQEFHFSKIAEPVFNQSRSSEDFNWLIRKTANPAVDNEHAYLIGLLLELNKKSTSGQAIDIKRELELIAEFAEQHFSHEEKIMASQGIDEKRIHADAHKKLLGYIGDAVNHAVEGRSTISPAFLKRIMRWWVEHTNGMDYDTFVLKIPLA